MHVQTAMLAEDSLALLQDDVAVEGVLELLVDGAALVGKGQRERDWGTTMTETGTVAFTTTVTGSGGKAGIVVPAEVIAQLGAGRRPSVHVEVNGYAYRSTVAVMGGRYLIGVNAGVREATGLQPGHPVDVRLSVATTPRVVDMPQDLIDALAADEHASAFFGSLSNGLQRFHADNINAAKTDETRQRRVAKALDLFREGKKR